MAEKVLCLFFPAHSSVCWLNHLSNLPKFQRHYWSFLSWLCQSDASYLNRVASCSMPLDRLIKFWKAFFHSATLCTATLFSTKNWFGNDSFERREIVSLTLSWAQENPKGHCGCRACLPSTSLLTLLAVLVRVGVVWRTTKMLSGLKQSGPLHKYMSLPSHPGCGISVDSCQNWTYDGGMKAPRGMGCGETPRRERYLWDLLKHSRDANLLYSQFMWWVKNILHGGTVWRQMAKMLHSTELNCHPHAKALLPPPAQGKLRK